MTRWSARPSGLLALAFTAFLAFSGHSSAVAQTPTSDPRPEVTTPAPTAAPAQTPSATPATPQSTRDDGYVLGVNDRVRVLVFGEASLSGEFLVDSTGRLAMPFIGEIPAAGLTRRALEEAIEKKLAQEEILLDPRVSVDLLNFRPYYILGEVTRPGEYPFTSGLNVFNAVATAGGFTTLANQTRVMIKRQGETTETEYSLLSPVTVEPGDTIRIIKGAFYILGEVSRPGEYPFSEGLTVQNAVATAGGFTYRANQRQVFIKHRNETQERKVRMNASLPVQPGDTIRITERFF
ncbi:MAG: SLBB domain-containing protein [Hyphomonadaceae bacterium]|nr:SLBB domain-containing protein [Hyphomonadaceae bacterium]